MRRTTLALGLGFAFAFVAACGDDQPSHDDAASNDAVDAVLPVDASRILPDAAVPTCTPTAGTTVALVPYVTGLDQPLAITAPDGDARVFIVEQTGAIRVVKNGALLPTPFLNLGGATGPVLYGGERGLLGLAFHPDFRDNDLFYVNFTRKPDGATVIAEFRATFGTDVADPLSRRDVLVIPQPYANHNGGWVEFGPGNLYIGMGDGGNGGDPEDRAQDDTELLGKMLRIDVDTRTGSKGYGIPAGNPNAASPDGANDPRPEIWDKGTRNPFRWSFDRGTGDLYIGDVGQGAWEEIDVAAPNAPGINWGWDDREGRHCYEPATGCLTAGRTDPVTEHAATANWHAIIGGQVYRGACFPGLVGQYFYGDFVAGELWAFTMMNGAAMNDRRLLQNVGAITAIHADSLGEIYVVTQDGVVRHLVAQ